PRPPAGHDEQQEAFGLPALPRRLRRRELDEAHGSLQRRRSREHPRAVGRDVVSRGGRVRRGHAVHRDP
ncbi:unnamed protein product, partial [Ectocarpus sp. 12 AP-2014]